MLKKTRRILLEPFCLFSFVVLISAALILALGATPAKAAADPANVTPDIKIPLPSPAAAAAKLAPGAKININSAAKTALEKLPGIGPIKAQAIIDGRPYKSIEDVTRVRGIKGKTFKVIKDHITVE